MEFNVGSYEESILNVFNAVHGNRLPMFTWDNYSSMKYEYNKISNSIECECLFEINKVSVEGPTRRITIKEVIDLVQRLGDEIHKKYEADYGINLIRSNIAFPDHNEKLCDVEEGFNFLFDERFLGFARFFQWENHPWMEFSYNKNKNSIECLCTIKAPKVSEPVLTDEPSEIYIKEVIKKLRDKVLYVYSHNYKIKLDNDYF